MSSSTPEEKKGNSSTGDTDTSLEQKVEMAQKFDKEMKDYAKATVKEFLGIYGYEEDVDNISMEDSCSETPRCSATPNINNPISTSSETLATGTQSTSSVSPLPSNVDKDGAQPAGSYSISSSTTNPCPEIESLEAGDVECSGTWSLEGDSIRSNDSRIDVLQDPRKWEGECRWCKKHDELQNFTYTGDGSNVVYEGLCSKTCFESVKRIRQGKGATLFTGNTSAGYLSQDNPMSTFSWDVYLAETQSTAAPWSSFKQSSSPPFNGFQTGMKLEASDPEYEGTTCVTTVVGILGSRIRLRFDGCDNSNDFWRMVDSKDIHPIGWCEGNGGVLQPPIGFKWDVGKFSNFLTKTLANGELAPVRLFKRQPHSPKSNLFMPNHKLEAVDRKNPVLVCVATVVEAVGDYIKIMFDGWKASKYTYRYDSRDIFPVGWCYFSGHPLQPPGPGYTKPRKNSADKNPIFTTAVRPLEVPGQLTYPLHSRGSPAMANADSASDDAFADIPTIALPHLQLTVELIVNRACYPGPYLDPIKISVLPGIFYGRIKEVLQKGIQAIVDAAYKPKTALGFLQPGRGKVVIKAQHGKEDVYTCCLQTVDRVSIFWNVIKRFSDNLRCCKNLFASTKLQGMCPKCQNEGAITLQKAKRDLAEQNKKVEIVVSERGEPSFKRQQRSLEEMTEGSRTLEREKVITEHSKKVEFFVGERKELSFKRQRRLSEEEMVQDIGSTSSPTTWTIDEVVRYFKNSDISQYAEVFRDHEIDGAALLLLTRDTIMSCMNFKLGPALKLLSHIDQLKTRFAL